MWIEKASEATCGNIFYLFEEFLDQYCYNHIRIMGKKEIADTESYEVIANNYIKDQERTFYFNDYSVMTDLMDNPSYVVKENNILNDTSWAIILYSKLYGEDEKQYKKDFKQYQLNRLQKDKEYIREMI